MCEWPGGKITVDESRACSDCFEAKPEEKVLWRVSTVKSNDLLRLDVELFHQPVSDFMDIVEELFVGPRLALKHEEYIVGVRPLGVVFKHMVKQYLALDRPLGYESKCVLWFW